MTFKNGTGGPGDRAGGVWTQPFSQDNCKGNTNPKSSFVIVFRKSKIDFIFTGV
jgi:hypothetical protein